MTSGAGPKGSVMPRTGGLLKRWPERTLQQRFDEKWIPEPNSGCWLWLAATMTQKGYEYGVFRVTGRTLRAHRFSYEREKGPIPEGLELDHLCRNPYCVNPDHLDAVTHEENLRRGKHRIHEGDNCKKCGELLVWRQIKRPRWDCVSCTRVAAMEGYYNRNDYAKIKKKRQQ